MNARRLLDILLSIFILLLLTPVLLLISIWIKTDSTGPVLFKQERVGIGGALFCIYKFRTMEINKDSEGWKITAANDKRITMSGRFLRKAKLDELPQLVNVLLGDMSLVGPRPEVSEYVQCYPADKKELILSVRPGITDPASIKYFNEGELLAGADNPDLFYKKEILPRKISIYEDYVKHRTMIGDLKILLSTLVRILGIRTNL